MSNTESNDDPQKRRNGDSHRAERIAEHTYLKLVTRLGMLVIPALLAAFMYFGDRFVTTMDKKLDHIVMKQDKVVEAVQKQGTSVVTNSRDIEHLDQRVTSHDEWLKNLSKRVNN